ncbi:hypothetical protein MHBO_003073, partial [Bonamia ostreae]
TEEKIELSKDENFNPLKQDTLKNKGAEEILRTFHLGTIPFNYGFLPQTWEDNKQKDFFSSLPGDDDPVDVVELSNEPIETGKIIHFKALGALCLIDQGETDWKIIGISSENDLFDKICNLDDIRKHFPGKIEQIKEWFVYYKTAEGKQKNKIGHEESVLGARVFKQNAKLDKFFIWKLKS